jgi:hypothetical protein
LKVWIYEAGRENMKVFASEEAAQDWLAKRDPEGVAFAYQLITTGELPLPYEAEGTATNRSGLSAGLALRYFLGCIH